MRTDASRRPINASFAELSDHLARTHPQQWSQEALSNWVTHPGATVAGLATLVRERRVPTLTRTAVLGRLLLEDPSQLADEPDLLADLVPQLQGSCRPARWTPWLSTTAVPRGDLQRWWAMMPYLPDEAHEPWATAALAQPSAWWGQADGGLRKALLLSSDRRLRERAIREMQPAPPMRGAHEASHAPLAPMRG